MQLRTALLLPFAVSRFGGRKLRRQGFTLIELLVSVALVLILIIGINTVFRIATDSAGAGQALSTVARDNRAASAMIYNDLGMAVTTDAPWFIIESRVRAAYANQQDAQGDRDADPLTIDIDGDNAEGGGTLGEVISNADYNYRNHRVDLLNFFVRGSVFRRSTGNQSQYISAISSNEGWISYGHARQYDLVGGVDNVASYLNPGAGTAATNPDNYYAQKWILARTQFVLTPNVDNPLTVAADPERHFAYTPLTAIFSGLVETNVENNAAHNADNQPAVEARQFTPPESRLDLLASTISLEKEHLTAHIAANPTDDWWEDVTYRAFCNPYVVKPVGSRNAAQASPYFVQGCTQFIVEFAGDFLRQNPATGAVERWYGQTRTSADPTNTDGEIDYIGAGGVKKVRWYGMPRNVDLSDDGAGPMIRGTGPVASLIDVVPLRDVLTAVGTFGAFSTFERQFPASKANYADTTNGMDAGDIYQAVWAPNQGPKPKMIRITMTLDDPNNRLSDGQTYEYVVELP